MSQVIRGSSGKHPSGHRRLLAMARRRGVLAARDAHRAGIHSQELTRLVEAGELERIARGYYRFSEHPFSEHELLAVAARAAPKGVICLLSALAFHEIGTEVPSLVWIAVERGTGAPSIQDLPLKVVQFSGVAFREGIEEHQIAGETVRVYSVAKTVADLFKYRNKLGVDIAIEALREAWRDRRFTVEELDRAARACRVARVMRPYIEAVIS